MDECVRLYLSLENGAEFYAEKCGSAVEIHLEERTGVADWGAIMRLDARDSRKLRDWLNENVKD
jgi:hypothetical protein